MEISVIVPTLNEENYLEDCLKSILRQTFPRNEYEIIVSDGSSEDRTIEIANNYADLVVVSKKRGIWWGRNYGAKFARGKFLVFIDADTKIKEDYLETVYNYMMRGVVGLTTGFELDGVGPGIKLIEYMSDGYWWLNSKIGNGSLIGINLCVPRDIFLKVGGFKEYALEDAAFDRELRNEGETLFLRQRKVITSPRRLEACGMIGLCRYYFELGLIDGGKIRNPHIINLLKYKNYTPVRISKKKNKIRYDGIDALSKLIYKWRKWG
ncbi:MAG: glycosyltransferase [Methanothrix sp.]|nr:glycosyltransferase [Methanothrix sp.]